MGLKPPTSQCWTSLESPSFTTQFLRKNPSTARIVEFPAFPLLWPKRIDLKKNTLEQWKKGPWLFRVYRVCNSTQFYGDYFINPWLLWFGAFGGLDSRDPRKWKGLGYLGATPKKTPKPTGPKPPRRTINWSNDWILRMVAKPFFSTPWPSKWKDFLGVYRTVYGTLGCQAGT